MKRFITFTIASLLVSFVFSGAIFFAVQGSVNTFNRYIKKQPPANSFDVVTDTFWHDVTVTCYNPTTKQCDSRPFETASGLIIDSANPISSHIVGISHDLKKYFHFRDSVMIRGVEPYEGSMWIVGDVGDTTLRNTVDLCMGVKDKMGKWLNAKICKIVKYE